MKFNYVLLFLLSGLFLSSCIKKEPPSAEADILSCSLSGDVMLREPIIENSRVILTVKADVNRTDLAPVFTLTPGATIYPASGTAQDFTNAQPYLVTSEDGNWSKEYMVYVTVAGITTEYNFDLVKQYVRPLYTYDIFYDIVPGSGDTLDWASGNAGFALTGMGTSDPASFPTSCTDNGNGGKCAMMQTKDAGSFGAGVGMPIAAGSLFQGTFNTISALTSPLKALRLGVPFEYVPTSLKGYFKYKAGADYQIDGKIVTGKTDTWDAYAVFYEVTHDVTYLDGSVAADNFSNANIVSYARITDADRKETDEWTEFYIPFITKPGKSIDRQKLKNGGYNISIVMTSSINGNYFEGAVGSTLLIDEVELIYASED